MTHMKRSFLALGLLAGLAGCGTTSGSTEPEPGHYGVYRVALNETKLSKDCEQPPPDPFTESTTDIKDGATMFIYGLVDEDVEQLYLDTGSDILLGGIEEDGSYKFTGKATTTAGIDGKVLIDSDHDGTDDNVDMAIDADGDGIDDKTPMAPDFMVDNDVDVDGDGEDDRGVDQLVDANNDGKDDNELIVPAMTKVTTSSTTTITVMDSGEGVSGSFKIVAKGSCSGPACAVFKGQSCTRTTTFIGVRLDGANVTVPLPNGEVED
jgi:hypothetical protein